MNLKKISEILKTLFTDGYSVNNITIKCEPPVEFEISKDSSGILIKFTRNLPWVEMRRFIKFKLNVEGLSFGENAGVIKIKNFPDMPFSYDDNQTFDNVYGADFDIDVSQEEINQTFQGASKRKIASKCLHYAKEWATIASLNGVRFDSYDRFDKFILKNKCYYFVEEQVKKDKDLQYGSFISIFILSLILPTIIKWAVDRVLRSLLT